jgi:hypothetical protein
MRGCIYLKGPSLGLRSHSFSLRNRALGMMTPLIYLNHALFSLMRPSLGIMSGAFALRSQPFALHGHLVFSFFPLLVWQLSLGNLVDRVNA